MSIRTLWVSPLKWPICPRELRAEMTLLSASGFFIMGLRCEKGAEDEPLAREDRRHLRAKLSAVPAMSSSWPGRL